MSLGLLLVVGVGVGADANAREGDRAVRLTVELSWSPVVGKAPVDEATNGTGVDLEVPGGRVVEAIPWPANLTGKALDARPDGVWPVGSGRSGRVRARIEAPLSSSLIIRSGGQVVYFPIAMIVEGPQRSLPQSGMPVEVSVERGTLG